MKSQPIVTILPIPAFLLRSRIQLTLTIFVEEQISFSHRCVRVSSIAPNLDEEIFPDHKVHGYFAGKVLDDQDPD
ncbi:hypothetical protein AKJ16_DCAP13024 [Drosera capensis]